MVLVCSELCSKLITALNCSKLIFSVNRCSIKRARLEVTKLGCNPPKYYPCLYSVTSLMSDSLQPHGLTVALQAPLSIGCSRQEHWSGLPCPPPGDRPHPGFEPRSSALQADSLLSEPLGKATSLLSVPQTSEALRPLGLCPGCLPCLERLYPTYLPGSWILSALFTAV